MSKETILFQGRFEVGADVFRAGKKIARVSQCTRWDDDKEIVVSRGNRAFLEVWNDFAQDWEPYLDLGPVEGLEIVEDCPRGCYCSDCYGE